MGMMVGSRSSLAVIVLFMSSKTDELRIVAQLMDSDRILDLVVKPDDIDDLLRHCKAAAVIGTAKTPSNKRESLTERDWSVVVDQLEIVYEAGEDTPALKIVEWSPASELKQEEAASMIQGLAGLFNTYKRASLTTRFFDDG